MTFQEILVEFDKRRAEWVGDHAVNDADLAWAIASILEKLKDLEFQGKPL